MEHHENHTYKLDEVIVLGDIFEKMQLLKKSLDFHALITLHDFFVCSKTLMKTIL